jgi:GNAT superfamily N-acetyltransferase
MVIIREYTAEDESTIRRCVVALQEFERTIDPRLLPGEEMADQYCRQIHAQCAKSAGCVFVAEDDGVVVGFVAVLSREPFTELDEPPGSYALIKDLIVLEPYRGRGTGRRLLQRAEGFVRAAGVTELRIGVLARNGPARALYLDHAFVPHLEILVKRW